MISVTAGHSSTAHGSQNAKQDSSNASFHYKDYQVRKNNVFTNTRLGKRF